MRDAGAGIGTELAHALERPRGAGAAHRRSRVHRRAAEGRNGQAKDFRRGISSYPALGDVVYRASQEELAKAYACDTETSIRVGHIQQDSSIPAMVKIDELLGKHFAVLGSTGTGKSCAVALILRRILEKNPQAHILLLDVHREYAPAFKEFAEVITPENMNLPFWLLNFEEIVEVLVGNQPSKDSDAEILRDLIPLAKLRYSAISGATGAASATSLTLENSNIGVDTPIPYRASDLVGLLDEQIGKLDLQRRTDALTSGSRRASRRSPATPAIPSCSAA